MPQIKSKDMQMANQKYSDYEHVYVNIRMFITLLNYS